MSDEKSRRVPLCVYSRADGGTYVDRDGLWDGVVYEHLPCCPLGLSSTQARRCPCKRRVVAGEFEYDSRTTQIRVLSCTFPKTRSGDTIRNPESFARYLRD